MKYKMACEQFAAQKMRKSLPEGFCVAPFKMLRITSEGKVFPCQFSNDEIGNISTPLDQLWASDKMNSYRNDFIWSKKGACQKSKDCFSCHKHNDTSLSRLEVNFEKITPNLDELIIEAGVDLELLKVALSKIHASLTIITLKFGNQLDLELINLFNDENIRLRIELPASTLAVSYPELSKLKKLETLTIIATDMLDNISLYSSTSCSLIVDLKLTETNLFIYHDFFTSGLEKSLQPNLRVLDYIYSVSHRERIELLTHFLSLTKKYDTFFHQFYIAIMPLWSSEESNAELKKIKQLYNIKYYEIRHARRNICPVPFNQISVYPKGKYTPCCWLGDYDLRDDQTKNEVAKVWNGKKLQNLRKEFISGTNTTCAKLIDEVSCIPKDQWKYGNVEFSQIQSNHIFKLHWAISGACNLKCQMCLNWQDSVELPESDAYFDDLKQNVLPFIGELELAGGEPFFQKRTFALIDFMKEKNPLCVWNITSNGQHVFGDKIQAAISTLRIGLFSISIDSLNNEIFNKIRVDGDLDRTLRFTDSLIAYNKNLPSGWKFDLNINFTIQKDNWTEIEGIITFCKSKKLGLYISPVVEPREYSIYDLEVAQKQKCLNHIKRVYETHKHENLLILIKMLGEQLRHL